MLTLVVVVVVVVVTVDGICVLSVLVLVSGGVVGVPGRCLH